MTLQPPRRHLGVTITGADDQIDPYELYHLSRFYPFIEWGVLFSRKRRGGTRYPSLKWISAIEEIERRYAVGDFRLSMHLCGEEARTAKTWASSFSPGQGWRRVQVNGYEPGDAEVSWREGRDRLLGARFKWILQARQEPHVPAILQDALDADAHVLLDPSGGEGIRIGIWKVPCAEYPTVRWGFAGGIGPDNVKEVVSSIVEANPKIEDFWIDMESGVRTDDGINKLFKFDLDKVRAVLEAVAEMRAEMRSVAW
jgi:hypothetical protein